MPSSETGFLFSRAQAEVLALKGYSVEAVDFLQGLREKFGLSFALGDRQNIAPDSAVAEDQQPDVALEFQAGRCLDFGYQYTVAPEGLLPRFIVRTHHLSRPEAR
jgi:internalin A